MADIILVLNAGSSSIKFRAFGVHGTALDLVLRGQVDGLHTAPRFTAVDSTGQKTTKDWGAGFELDHQGAIEHIGAFLRSHGEGHRLIAVGHRIVHGGQTYSGPVPVTPAVLDELEKLIPLAPLHQPHNLSPIRIIARIRPELPQVACFDTAFHRSAPEVAQAYALPPSITEMGVRRYGFHGLSYEYIASVLPQIAPAAAAGRTVVAHLGNGASMCAIMGGRSVASTMGFTAVDGLPMGTRCGNLDPGVILYLMASLKMDRSAGGIGCFKRYACAACKRRTTRALRNRYLHVPDCPRARFPRGRDAGYRCPGSDSRRGRERRRHTRAHRARRRVARPRTRPGREPVGRPLYQRGVEQGACVGHSGQ
jgi:acetate kinase